MKSHKQKSFLRREFPEAKENIERISPREVRQGLESGRLLLVCAYEDEARFRRMQLEGAISFSEFQSKLPSLSKDQQIVFY
ncbi:MAG: ArsR family transcriptional regulator [Deltaproteobacteria bacterium]|nr:ArsR family transcriptional regulator [Deltaproteobacteria bacterium]